MIFVKNAKISRRNRSVGYFIKSGTFIKIIKVIVILAVVFVLWSLGCFIYRIIKKYKVGLGKDYYPPAD